MERPKAAYLDLVDFLAIPELVVIAAKTDRRVHQDLVAFPVLAVTLEFLDLAASQVIQEVVFPAIQVLVDLVIAANLDTRDIRE